MCGEIVPPWTGPDARLLFQAWRGKLNSWRRELQRGVVAPVDVWQIVMEMLQSYSLFGAFKSHLDYVTQTNLTHWSSCMSQDTLVKLWKRTVSSIIVSNGLQDKYCFYYCRPGLSWRTYESRWQARDSKTNTYYVYIGLSYTFPWAKY